MKSSLRSAMEVTTIAVIYLLIHSSWKHGGLFIHLLTSHPSFHPSSCVYLPTHHHPSIHPFTYAHTYSHHFTPKLIYSLICPPSHHLTSILSIHLATVYLLTHCWPSTPLATVRVTSMAFLNDDFMAVFSELYVPFSQGFGYHMTLPNYSWRRWSSSLRPYQEVPGNPV